MKQTKNGFTLVELLAVIALIGILAGFVFPALRNSRIQARRAATKSKIMNLELAINGYFNDFGRYPDLDPNRIPNHIPAQIRNNATAEGYPEYENDCVMLLLTGRYYDPSPNRIVEDPDLRDEQRGWNGPYMEVQNREYTSKTSIPQANDRRVYRDGWRVQDGSNEGDDTYFYFQFPATRVPQQGRIRTVAFNVDSFDIYSLGPDGAGMEDFWDNNNYRISSNWVLQGNWDPIRQRQLAARTAYDADPENKDNISNWDR